MNNESKLVVFDIDVPELLNNKVFDPSEATKISHTYLPTCYLFNEAKNNGIDFITPDVYFSLSEKPKKVFMITHLKSTYTSKLIEAGVVPLILTCQESPFIATRFYMGLKKYSAKFKYSFVFSGMKKMLSNKTIYKQMFFPESYSSINENPLDYKDRLFLVVISSAKGVGSLIKSVLLKLIYGFGVKEIYPERRRSIKFFSQKQGFDLYGFGWDKANFKDLKREDIDKCYRGTVIDKVKTLSQYKFVLCFENAIFPGYITEKIFDPMFAGCVPVYFGAPDIEKYVDKEAFINFANFKNYDALYEYLLVIDENQYNNYLSNIKKYLNSENYKKFTQEYYAKQCLDIITQEFQK